MKFFKVVYPKPLRNNVGHKLDGTEFDVIVGDLTIGQTPVLWSIQVSDLADRIIRGRGLNDEI